MILSIDVGTTLFKLAIIDFDGNILEKKTQRIEQISGSEFLHYEIDTNQWIKALSNLINSLNKKNLDNISNIIVSGNGPTVIAVDENGNSLMNALSWMDRRASKEIEIIKEKCNINIEASYALPKILWIKNNKQKIYNRTKYFLGSYEYINYLLTGEVYTILPAKDYGKYIWSYKNIDLLGMDKNKFPPFLEPGKILGKTTKKTSSEFSLKKGIPVISGGPDFIMSLLGTGAVSSGLVCDRSGSSSGINLCSPVNINDKRLLVLSHISENLYNISGLLTTTGKAFEWIKNVIKCNNFDNLFENIKKIKAGSENLVFLPHLAGERSSYWGASSKGAFIGLNLKHGDFHLARAVLESVGYASREIIEMMEENSLSVESLRTTGGLSAYDEWNQVRADIINKPIYTLKSQDSDLLGNACVVLKAVGNYKTIKEASEAIVKLDKEYLPNLNNKIYNELFEMYKESFNSLKRIFAKLDEIS